MQYFNTNIRRQDRLLDEAQATELLKKGEYGIFSVQAEEGGAYGIPINYAWDGKQSIYLHCAPEGRKLRCIKICNRVSFCIVGHTQVISNKFSTAYESIVLNCLAFTNLPEVERMKGLELLLDKYSPSDKVKGMQYAKNSFERTEIIRLDITRWSGKCKRIM